MVNELTHEQQELIGKHAKAWVNRAYSCFWDKQAAATGVEWLYGFCGMSKPYVWHVDSPVMAKLIISFMENTNVWDNVGDNVRANVWDNVWANVRDNVRANVGANVRANVWDNVRDNVRDNVWANVRADFYVNWSDFGWVAFYEYFRIGGFDNSIFANPKAWSGFDKFCSLIKSGVFETYSFKNVCFVVRPPIKIIKNEQGLLHNLQGPAIEFADGYIQYYINGRCLPSWIWEDKELITRDRFLQEKNAEIRGGMYAVLGQKKVFDLIGAEEICRKFANNEWYILYRTNELIGGKYWQWIGVKCPSTNTDYLLGVPETVTCPIEGAAGLFGLASKDYIINQHT